MMNLLRKTTVDSPPDSQAIVGRSFVLGLPDRQGLFRIFLQGAVWRIAPGAYQAGDRVLVTAVEADRLLVQQ